MYPVIQEEIMEKHLLIVARWPLGGIRTYMRYLFRHLPAHYHLTLLASQTHEDAALMEDAVEYGARLIIMRGTGTKGLAVAAFRELRTNRYDVILSQGFISAMAVYMANLFFRVPHIITIHGILEPKYLTGRFGGLKRFFLRKMITGITVLYAVSNDILSHLYEQFPGLENHGPRAIVIPNGIEPVEFDQLPAIPVKLREKMVVDDSTFLFGFFGRFMPQKGFDLLIDAIDIIRQKDPGRAFLVAAVGSGDYLREYQTAIRERELEQYFHFLPFQPQVYHLYPQVDSIVMPSRWEACPLLPMEALCMGTPVIASDCIGLRETVADTPTMVFASEDVKGLSELMLGCMQNNSVDTFQRFASAARARYDVSKSASELVKFIENMQDWK